MIETNLVGWHSRIIGTFSHLSKSCLLIRFLGFILPFELSYLNLIVKCTNKKMVNVLPTEQK
jgi:hypothetical protein